MPNVVVIDGNLGADPESQFTKNGTAVATLRLAHSEKKSKDNKVTYWFNIKAFGTLAEVSTKYLKKGSKICVTGSLEQRTWDKEDGSKQNFIDIIANKIDFISVNMDGEQQHAPAQQNHSNGKSAPKENDLPPPTTTAESDIPF
jgi:single-strand DNA-binding protein